MFIFKKLYLKNKKRKVKIKRQLISIKAIILLKYLLILKEIQKHELYKKLCRGKVGNIKRTY